MSTLRGHLRSAVGSLRVLGFALVLMAAAGVVRAGVIDGRHSRVLLEEMMDPVGSGVE